MLHPGVAPERVDGDALVAAVDGGLEPGRLVSGLAATGIAFEQDPGVLGTAEVEVVSDQGLEECPRIPGSAEQSVQSGNGGVAGIVEGRGRSYSSLPARQRDRGVGTV
jgi:hypothetical protein